MRQRLCILFLSLSFSLFAEKRALVIGIGEYPDVDYGWHAINGDNDIELTQTLLLNNGFTCNNICTLRNEQATYTSIIYALKQLIHQSGQGDIVYIHFSGHGQQITDLNGDEEDGYDESWIPYDALQEPTLSYNGERHLIDDELNFYLCQIYQRIGSSGRLIVVSDACHSGTSTRDLTDPDIIRGSSAKFIRTNDTKEKAYSPQPIQWIAISACADNECNRQHNNYGSLSYAMYLLRNQFTAITLDSLQQYLQTTIAPLVSRPQSPQVEIPDRYPHTNIF